MQAVNIYPRSIQNILEQLQENVTGDWGDVWNAVTDERDRQITETLCPLDCCDFIVMDGKDAFLFLCNDQTGEWTVSHVGEPVYCVEPEMIGDADVDFDAFLSELQHELKGIDVRRGSALNNDKSEFVRWFHETLDKAFDTALENV